MLELAWELSVTDSLPLPCDAESLAFTPQPLKEAAAATFILSAVEEEVAPAAVSTDSVANSRPPSWTLLEKNSPIFISYYSYLV